MLDAMPRVSVLLTCYNHLPYLREAVADLRTQTFRDFEVIVLDDGSTDGTREWLADELPKLLPEARVELNPENLGTYGTLNRGLTMATGEFIAILNDDDRWAPIKLEQQVAKLDHGPEYGLVHTGGWFIDAEGQQIPGAPLDFPYPSTHSGDVFASLIYYNKVIHSSAMFRRACLERIGPYSDRFYGCGDWHLWLRISEHWHVAFLDQPLTFYRVHATNACRNVDRMNEDSLTIRHWLGERTIELQPRMTTSPEVRAALAHNFACLGTELTWAGRPAEGRAAYRDSLRIQPRRLRTYVRYGLTYLPRSWFRRLN